jgi:enoyl-CoA hydratase/carnithine racemase/3-hydroxyacyl-CoA dehydrogenase
MTAINDVTDYTVENRVAVVTIDSPPVNALGHIVRLGISAGLDQALSDQTVIAVVLRCAGSTFFAGADITEFGKPMASPVLREIAVQIEQACKPVVAAIHGTALGGGLETALACHWRMAARSARLGLPEVKLGLLAGAGGTQRLPRLVGAAKALEMVVSGDPIDAQGAFESGLVDLLAESDLRGEAIAFAASVATRKDALRRVRDMPPPSFEHGLFAHFRSEKADRLRGFEAPEASIQCIEAAVTQSFDEGMKTERGLFEQLMTGVQCAAQRYVFFAERDGGKVPGLPKSVVPRPIAAVALFGADCDNEFVKRLRAAGVCLESADVPENLPTALSTPSTIVFNLVPDVKPHAAARGAEIFTNCCETSKSASTVPVRFAPSVEAPQLMEILRTRHVTDEILASVLALSKRVGLASVVTYSGGDLIGRRMIARLEREVERCIADGVPVTRLLAVASDFGLTLNTPGIASDRPCDESAGDLLDRLIVPLINEGATLLEAGVAARASDIDVVCVKQGFFKAYRGGPMFHAGYVGLRHVLLKLREYELRWGVDYCPSPLIERLVETGQTLHQFKGLSNG